MSIITNQTSKWTSHLDNADSIYDKREIALGQAFASTVSRLSTPQSRNAFERHQANKKKEVSGLKLYFLEDPQFTSGVIEIDDNPTFDSHYRIVDDLWAKPGKKLSDEARLISQFDRDLVKEQMDSHVKLLDKLKKNYVGNTLGPLKKEEYPDFKKPDKVFGRTREVNAFLKAKAFARPKKHWTRVNPEVIVQPDLYPHKDVWTHGNGPVSAFGSSSFISQVKRFDIEIENTLVDKDTGEAVLNTSLDSPSRLTSPIKATLDIASRKSAFDSSTGLFLSEINASVTNASNLSYNAKPPYESHPIFKYPISSPIQYVQEKEWPREIRYSPTAELNLKDLVQQSILSTLASNTKNSASPNHNANTVTSKQTRSISVNIGLTKQPELPKMQDDLSVSSMASSQINTNKSLDSQDAFTQNYKDYVKSFVAMHLKRNESLVASSTYRGKPIFVTDEKDENFGSRPISRSGPLDEIKLEPLIQKLLSTKPASPPDKYTDLSHRGTKIENLDRDSDIPYDNDKIDGHGNIIIQHISNDSIPSASRGSRPITAPHYTPPIVHSKSMMRKKFETRVLTTAIPAIVNDLPANSKGVLTNTADLIPVDIGLGVDLRPISRPASPKQRPQLYAPKPKSEERLSSSQEENILEQFKLRHKSLSESSLLVKKSSTSALRSTGRAPTPATAEPQRGQGDTLGANRREKSLKRLAPSEISRASCEILDVIAAKL